MITKKMLKPNSNKIKTKSQEVVILIRKMRTGKSTLLIKHIEMYLLTLKNI